MSPPSPIPALEGADPFRAVAAAHAPLAITTRGSILESAHVGSVAVVDLDGRLLGGAGNPWHRTATRSALKPFQAVPFVAAAGLERFGYSTQHAALLCASHSGEPRHVELVAAILRRAGNSPEDLQCGTQAPGFYDARGEVPPPPPYSPLAHNCSGKHSGMLAYCVQCGVDKADYLDYDHPLQRAIRAAVAHCLETPESELQAGVDGCSAPNYAVPLGRLALGYARLAADADDPRYGRTLERLGSAMREHPELVSGEGRSDLALMRAGRGDWVTKVGAEGVQGIGVRSRGIGIAIKVADGSKRALYPAVVAVLDQLGLLDSDQRQALAAWRTPAIRNYRGFVTGEVRPVVEVLAPACLPGGTPTSGQPPPPPLSATEPPAGERSSLQPDAR
ncbi:MAG: asparaginase [Casimicrobiaceae bacterium]